MDYDEIVDNTQQLLDRNKRLPSIISSLNGNGTLSKRLENIKLASNYLSTFQIKELEDDLLIHIMPAIQESIKEIFQQNSTTTALDNEDILNNLKHNLQISLDLLEVASQVLQHISQHDSVELSVIPSVPLNLALILFDTFEHCKDSQVLYGTNLAALKEILELFRSTQAIFSRFLLFLERSLAFNFKHKSQVSTLKDLLSTLCKLGEVLAGMNVKSMVENWKVFTSLTGKYADVLTANNFDLSLIITVLNVEINKNLGKIVELNPERLVNAQQNVRVISFLVKVAVKLLETFWPIIESFYNEIINFCLTVHSFPVNYFRWRQFPNSFMELVQETLFENINSLINRLMNEETFLKKLTLHEENCLNFSDNHLGSISFFNQVLKCLPVLVNDQPEKLGNFNLFVVRLIFNSTNICFKEFLWDSSLYEELVLNISAATLLYPNSYPDIEGLLFGCLLQKNIWTSLLALDIWCLILSNSPCSTRRATLIALLAKIDELNFGIFTAIPEAVYLKVLTRRIFEMLPNSERGEIVAKNAPSTCLPVWQILELKAVPLPQRFHVEQVLNDLYEKIDATKGENWSLEDALFIGETLEIVSCVDFGALHLNCSKLVTVVSHLWSFNSSGLPSNNNFFKYFITKLTKVTEIVIFQVSGGVLLLILNQLKLLLNESIFKLLVCQLLRPLSQRNVEHCQEKFSLFSLIADIFITLINDKCPIIAQIASENFQEFSNSNSYSPVVKKVTSSSVEIGNFTHKKDNDPLHAETFFFTHQCLEWSESAVPQLKRIKIDLDPDDPINKLKNETVRLQNAAGVKRLTSKQLLDIRDVINKLEVLF